MTECTDELRRHIESKHGSALKKGGTQRVNNAIFWRAKRGLRRISSAAVNVIFVKYRGLALRRQEVMYFLENILKLCLVEIGNDKV